MTVFCFSNLYFDVYSRTPRSNTSMTTPESSVSESDVSPQLVRRRRPHIKDQPIPKLSISMDEDHRGAPSNTGKGNYAKLSSNTAVYIKLIMSSGLINSWNHCNCI